MNRFSSLKIESEEPQQQTHAAPVKKEQAPKKVVVKKAPKNDDAPLEEGYERVTEGKQQ